MAKLKIDVNDLHKHYGKNEVLKGITTKFYEGDVVCIIGPSGSGKSTFLRSLNLLEEVTSGHITVNGYDLTEKTTNVDHVRENIGMVFQHFNLFPHMSVLDNITFAPIEHKLMTKEEAEKLGMELLDKVGLADKANANPDSLSGGQKQRVAIARGLAMNPDIMLFD
ncbi:MAG: Excinuclease ABC subunit B [Streptococcus sp. DORA_10]|nr:MAG: Excinuclease ABC subunit B [Streptococcus sp. DORA_10]